MYYYSVAISKNPLNKLFTYSSDTPLKPGSRVKVQFAKRKKDEIAYVISEIDVKEQELKFEIKKISEITDDEPLIDEAYLNLLNWIVDYYMNPPGVVYDLVFKNIDDSKVEKETAKKQRETKSFSDSKEIVVINKKMRDIPMTKISDTGIKIIQYLYFYPDLSVSELKKALGLKNIGPVKTLINHQILELKTVIGSEVDKERKILELSAEQKKVVSDFFTLIKKDKKKHLLYGITGSGKTEVYFEIMKEYLNRERQILFLLPEIALTPQIFRRIKERFPEKDVVLYHSGLTTTKRKRIFEDALNSKIDILLGTRSAMWIPLKNLAAVFVDEEHDESFMQSDGIPVYDTKKAITKLCELKNIPLMSGSATPEIESYHAALENDFSLHKLKSRPKGLKLPEVLNVDLSKREKIRGFLTQDVIDAIENTLKNNGQCMILTGKKGYASYVSCAMCGYTIKCPNCDVSLTYHKGTNLLKCHYCGHTREFEHVCPSCGSSSLIPRGFGSERVEDQIQLLFPDTRILRVDRDIAPREADLIKAWKMIENRETDIIVGTRIISKGLNFPDIQLVIILNADQMLYFPDFRSTERTFSLIHQMSGRAGRGKGGARVIVQSYSPETSSIKFAEKNDFESFFNAEIKIREQAGYPPFTNLILFESKDEKKEKALQRLERLREFIEKRNDLENFQILGPVEAFITRLSGKYRYHMLIKSKKGTCEIEQFKRIMKENDKYIRDITVIIDPRKTII